jgi:MFS transporter, SP family, solute carrier family 2 (facilitated glucose transporter), member 3
MSWLEPFLLFFLLIVQNYVGIANFFVGLVFLPLRNALAGGDPMKEGRVFYVFAALLLSTAFALSRVYRG